MDQNLAIKKIKREGKKQLKAKLEQITQKMKMINRGKYKNNFRLIYQKLN